METFYPGYEARAEINARVVFVDLDETFLEGTVCMMSDEELQNAEVNQTVLSMILRAKSKGLPVVLLTRNNPELIERFFAAKPEYRYLFDEEISSYGQKSDDINNYCRRNGIQPDEALFADDTQGELDDVTRNCEGSKAVMPNQTGDVSFDNHEYGAEIFRLRFRRAFHRSQLTLADDIDLAA